MTETRPHSPSQWWVGDPQTVPLLSADNIPPAVLLREGFLDPHACAQLIEAFKRNQHRAPRVNSPYWNGRFIWSTSLPVDTEREALRVLQRIRNAASTAVCLHFGLTRPIYSDTIQLVHWPAGIELTPHADNIEPNGKPNYTPHRSYSAVVYLNDDYTGGHTYFPFLSIRIQPRTGSLLAFKSGSTHVHGVTRVEHQDRYTCAMWFTFDPAKEDKQARIIY